MTWRGGTLTATLHLTHDCNLRCTYCYAGAKSGAGMSDETARQAVDFALAEARRHEAQHLEVVFFGGEPLLRHDLLCRVADRVVAGAAAGAGGSGLRVSFKMSTNGLLLSERVVRELAARRVYVSASVDGGPEVHDLHRRDARGQGTAAALHDALDRLLAWNPCAHVTCVVTPATAGRLDESVRWLCERGFAYVAPTLDYGAAWTADDLDRLEAGLRRLADWYVAETVAGRRFYVGCLDERIRTRTRGPLAAAERCSAGVRQFSIAPSGRLYPCVQFVGEDRDAACGLGDVVRGWDEDRRATFARAVAVPKSECNGCALGTRCASWCACVNWRSTGRVDRVSPLLCEYERRLMPIADDAANRLWQRRDPNFLHKQYNPAFPVLSFVERLTIREQTDA